MGWISKHGEVQKSRAYRVVKMLRDQKLIEEAHSMIARDLASDVLMSGGALVTESFLL